MQHRPEIVVGSGPQVESDLSGSEVVRPQVCSNPDLSFLTEVHEELADSVAEPVGRKRLWPRACQFDSCLGHHTDEASGRQLVHVVGRIADSIKPTALVCRESRFASSTMHISRQLNTVIRARCLRTRLCHSAGRLGKQAPCSVEHALCRP